MQITLGCQRDWFCLATSVHANERPQAAVASPGNVNQVAGDGNVEIGHAIVPAHLEPFQNREGLPVQLEAIWIKADGEDLSVTRVQKIPLRIPRVSATLKQHLSAPGAE
jgi:hypothetical protein